MFATQQMDLPAGNVGNSKSLNTTRPRVQISRAAWPLQSPILGYLWGIWILWFKGTSMVPIPGLVYEHHTNTMVPWDGKPIPYPTHTNTMLPYHTMSSHTIPYHHTKLSQGVWGPFSKYINYFCRLQYWSIGCHFLWRGSSCFFWDIKLQMEAI